MIGTGTVSSPVLTGFTKRMGVGRDQTPLARTRMARTWTNQVLSRRSRPVKVPRGECVRTTLPWASRLSAEA